MKHVKEVVWLSLAGLLLLIGIAGLTQWRSGLVFANFPEDFKVGNSFSGKLTLGIEEGDSIEKDTPILFALSKGDKIVASETLTFKEFLKLSGKEAPLTEHEGKLYFQTPGNYEVNIEDILDYRFDEPGEYESLLNIFKLDLTFKKKFIVTE